MKVKFSIRLMLIATLALILLVVNLGNVSQANAQSWTLVWSDEFNGTGQPNSANWNYHVGNGFNPGAGAFDGWGNGEWEWYRPQNCYQSGGNLVMKAEYNTTPTNIAGRDWYQFSCRITSDTKKSIQYGAIEARMQLPNNWGTWPAFWMMGDACDDTSTSSYAPAAGYYDRMASNWASCGEIDIMEHRNLETIIFNNLFWDSRIGVLPWDGPSVQNNPTQTDIGPVNVFRTYRLEWTSTQLKWLIDGVVRKTQDISPSNMEEFRNPFHIIMNLALSGQFTGNAGPNQAEFPLYMNVDYVRVYQAGGSVPTNTPAPQPTATPTSGTNVARGKAASALNTCASTEGAALAFDGSTTNNSKWCGFVTGGSTWLKVDLGSNYSVNNFVIKHAGAGGESTSWNTRDFQIQTSTDNTNWSTAVTVTGNTASITSHGIAARTARYARLWITVAGSDTAARIYEFEVYGTPASSTSNLALNKPATASTTCASTEGPEKAVNGSVSGGNSDKWCAPGESNWMRVDLGSNRTITSFVVKHAGAGGESTSFNTRNFIIELSTDGATWYPQVNVTGNTASITTHNIAAFTARYARLYVTQPEQGTGGAARIYEFEVYGQ